MTPGDVKDAFRTHERTRTARRAGSNKTSMDRTWPESARQSWRLLPLRGWRNAKVQQILPGGA
jgi:hypothetical protein